MADVIFEDNTVKIINAMEEKINAKLRECAGEIVSATRRNFDTFPRVKSGNTKGSFEYKVDEGTHTAYMGSNYQNAIWEEFGTGEHSIKGGRQGGWRYKDANGDWHFTRGKKPSRAFYRAYESNKTKIIKNIENSLKG